MILTVCPSPCIDVTIELGALNVGKMNLVKSKRLAFTGKALNVAIGVSRLGGDAYATGFMYNENGMLFEQTLDREGVPFTFVWNRGRVRENYKFIDNKSMLTEINDIGEIVEEYKQIELLRLVQDLSYRAKVAVISGSLPRGVEASYYYDLFRCLPQDVIKICDCDGDRLLESLKVGVDLVKPNVEELENTLQVELKTRDDMMKACYTLIDKGAKQVILSLGKDGAIYTDGTHAYYCKSIHVAVNSTVGAGDAMLAACALRIEQGADMKEVLRSGVAAGTASVTTFGNISFTREKFNDVYNSLTIEEIKC